MFRRMICLMLSAAIALGCTGIALAEPADDAYVSDFVTYPSPAAPTATPEATVNPTTAPTATAVPDETPAPTATAAPDETPVPTPLGTYRSTEQINAWHYFRDYNCWAQYAYRISGAYYFHSVLYKKKGGTPTASSVRNLGRRASHGCVRLSVENEIGRASCRERV